MVISKRSTVVVLVGLNVFLLAVLLLGSYSLPAVQAQSKGGRPGDFVCLTAKAAGQTYDVVYILDKPQRKLHAFYPTNARANNFAYAKLRDLKADFGR